MSEIEGRDPSFSGEKTQPVEHEQKPVDRLFADYAASFDRRYALYTAFAGKEGTRTTGEAINLRNDLVRLQPEQKRQIATTLIRGQIDEAVLPDVRGKKLLSRALLSQIQADPPTKHFAIDAYLELVASLSERTSTEHLGEVETTGRILLSTFKTQSPSTHDEFLLGRAVVAVVDRREGHATGHTTPDPEQQDERLQTISRLLSIGLRPAIIQRHTGFSGLDMSNGLHLLGFPQPHRYTLQEDQPSYTEAESLADKEHAEHMDGVFNHEAKMMALGIIAASDSPQTPTSITRAMGISDESGGMTKSTIRHYCRTFERLGLVEKTDGGVYRMKPRGQLVADAVSQLAAWSEQHPDISVQDIFSGSYTETPGLKPPLRVQVLQSLLATNEPLSDKELLAQLGGQRIVRHLESLARNDIITYTPPNVAVNDTFTYEVASDIFQQPEDVPVFQKERTLGKGIAEVLQQTQGTFNVSTVESALIAMHPQFGNLNRASLRSRIARALNSFTDAGFLSSTRLTDITLTDLQRERLNSLFTLLEEPRTRKVLTLLEDPQDGEPAQYLSETEQAHTFFADTSRIAAQIRKARDHSPYTNLMTYDEMRAQVLDALALSEGTIDAGYMEEVLDFRLSRSTISAYLRRMATDKDLIGTKEGSLAVYKRAPHSGVTPIEFKEATPTKPEKKTKSRMLPPVTDPFRQPE